MNMSILIRILLIAPLGSLVLSLECGTSTSSSVKYPWLANIRTSLETQKSGHCAGALIDNQNIVTAASCLHLFGNLLPASDITVYLGSPYAFSDDTTPYHVKSIKIAKDFNYYSKTKANNIAILTLENPVASSDSISPICLPNLDSKSHESKLTVAGWPMNEKRKRISDKAIETEVEILAHGRCFRMKEINSAIVHHPIQNVDWRIKSTKAERFSESQMCANEIEYGSEVCSVDIGGPLMQKNSAGQWTLVGVASDVWGGCSDPEFNAAVYTRITSFKDLIREVAPASKWV